MSERVLASGGLVFRPATDGFEVLVVHRPKYDDWSLPKGKQEPWEDPSTAAVREVEEETGVVAHPVRFLDEVSYGLPDGRTKVVRYFVMRPLRERAFRPNGEVDQVRWLPVEEALRTLTYERDRRLITAVDLDRMVKTGRVFLVRHAEAARRSNWNDDDRLRPLTAEGVRQAEMLASRLVSCGVHRILSSPYLRCLQTVEPLARRLGLPVEETGVLGEGGDWEEALRLLEENAGFNVVACSHGDVIPKVVEAVAGRGASVDTASTEKGSYWELVVEDGRVTAAFYHPPPGGAVGGPSS